MAVRDWFKKKDKPAPTLNAGVGTKDSYQGPVQQGTSETVFRKTGTSTSPGSTNVTSTSSTPSGVGSSSSSGRSSGGKIISTGKTVTLPQSTLETPTLSAGGLEKPVDIKLNRDGGITVGSRTYVGNAVIPELGNISANQYKNKLRQELMQKGSIPRGTGYGRFSYKTQTGIEEISPGEKIIYDKYGNTSAITSEFFGKTFKTIDEYNAAIDKYNKQIGRESATNLPTSSAGVVKKTYGSKGEYSLTDSNGNVSYYAADGTPLYSGQASPAIHLKGKESWADALAIATLGAGGAVSFSTRAALALNSKNIITIMDKSETNKTRVASLKELALSLGTAAAGGAAFGAAGKLSEDALTATGIKILANVLKRGGSTGSVIARNILGLSIKGIGKLTRAAIETYFKAQLIKQGTELVKSAKSKNWRATSFGATEIAGMLVGYPIGSKVAGKGFEYFSKSYVPAGVERINVKRSPASIQADILTGKEEFYGYRRGPLETGMGYTPRLDKYLSSKIKNPTESVFFRIEETKGVKGKKILPSLSVPDFVQPPRYKDMFINNLKNAKGNAFKRLVDAFAKTPVMTDVLSVGKFKTKKIPQELRDKVIREHATTGKLSKKTQRELLKYDTLLSDKIREVEFADEQEAVFRNSLKLKNTKVGFTRDSRGRLIPVIYEKGTLKPEINKLLKNKIITQQDAKFIQRQWDMWKKFKDEYILPKQHSVAHSKAVMENVRKIVLVYPEFGKYFRNKYGSVENAIKEIQKGAQIHDLGKTTESSKEFGTSHGPKVYNVGKAGLLPKEIGKIKPEVLQAIRNHETIAGTSKGITSLKYKVFDMFGRYSLEEKILATADRLDLIRYKIKVDPRRLPLSDVMERLNVKNGIKQESMLKKEIYKDPYKPKGYNPSFYLTSGYGKNGYVKEPAKYQPIKYPKNYLIVNYPEYKKSYNKVYPKKPSYSKSTPYPTVNYTPNYLVPGRYPPKKSPPKKVPGKPQILTQKEISKIKKEREKRGKEGYMTLPTVYDELIGRVGRTTTKKISGFEVSRIA